MLYTIKLSSGNRLAVNLLDVLAVEEVIGEDDPSPGGVPPVKKRYLRLFLRNGASFTVTDNDREMFDHILQTFKFGNINEPEDYNASS